MLKQHNDEDRIGFTINCPGALDHEVLIPFRKKGELSGESIIIACSKISQSKREFSLNNKNVIVKAAILPKMSKPALKKKKWTLLKLRFSLDREVILLFVEVHMCFIKLVVVTLTH